MRFCFRVQSAAAHSADCSHSLRCLIFSCRSLLTLSNDTRSIQVSESASYLFHFTSSQCLGCHVSGEMSGYLFAKGEEYIQLSGSYQGIHCIVSVIDSVQQSNRDEGVRPVYTL